MWINFLALSLAWFLLIVRLFGNPLCFFNELLPSTVGNNGVESRCWVLTIPLANKSCYLPQKTFKFKNKCNYKVGTSMVVFLIPVNTSSIRSTKFACVVDWSKISMVPIISIDCKTTYLSLSSRTKQPSPYLEGFVSGRCIP
jgi:hypothetical protein